MSDACDINKILGRFRTTGFITHTNLRRPVYEDFGSTESYQDAMNKIRRAEAVFAALPARVRQRVNNDPAQLIDFVENPENDDELIELGLKNKPSATPLAAATEQGPKKKPRKKGTSDHERRRSLKSETGTGVTHTVIDQETITEIRAQKPYNAPGGHEDGK